MTYILSPIPLMHALSIGAQTSHMCCTNTTHYGLPNGQCGLVHGSMGEALYSMLGPLWHYIPLAGHDIPQ